MQKRIRVLLLDGQTVQAYSVSKALHHAGMLVTVFCEKKLSYGYASRYPDNKIKCPSIKRSPDNFYAFLKEFLNKYPHDVLIPLFDESANFSNENRERIEECNIKIALPDKSVFDLAGNKDSLMHYCHQNKIPHPATISLENYNLNMAANLIGFPSLIKPQKSSGALGIIYLNSFEDLKINYPLILNQYGECSLQAYVDHSGFYYNAMVHRGLNGCFSKIIIIKIKRYFPTKGGTGSYSEVVEYPRIEQITKDLLDKLNWIGFADLDFIVETKTDEPKLIEINPRIPACIHASYISGINFPQIIICDILNLNIPNQQFIANQKLRFFALDFIWFLFSKERFKSKPSWFCFFSKDLHYQDGSFFDFLTMGTGIIMGILKYLNPSFRKSKFKNS